MGYFKIEHSDKHETLRKIINGAPKAQLHLHLDGSLSFEFIMASLKRLKQRKKDMIVFEKNWEPSTEEELVAWMMKVAHGEQLEDMKTEDCENWRVFTVCNYFLQTKPDLVEATHDLVMRMARQHNVNYIEIRFAPVLHTDEGLTEDEAVLAVLEGFDAAKAELAEKQFELNGGVICCALRSFPVTEAFKTVQLIQRLNNNAVLGFDIAGDEGTYPLKLFEDVIKLAIKSNISVTVHAGEWNEVTHGHIHDNLRLAVELGVNRIGHGLALRSLNENDDIFVKMNAKKIAVEVCLTSNCDNPEKCPSFGDHPISKLLKNEVLIGGLNVDNLLLAGNHTTGLPDPSGEFTRAILDCGLLPTHLLNIIETSYRAALKPLPEKFIEDSLKVWKEKIIPLLEN